MAYGTFGLFASAALLIASTAGGSAQTQKNGDQPARNGLSTSTIDNRHATCLTFMRQNQLYCDPWFDAHCGMGKLLPDACVAPSPIYKDTNQQPRHEDCLSFAQQNKLSCDPWFDENCAQGKPLPASCTPPAIKE
jgi:hypothetical protein